jgi:methylenetetrahydrofolate reductase (NADPH)
MSTAGQAPSSPEGAKDAVVSRIAAFARKASFETTRLTEQDLADVRNVAPKGCAIYVSAIPSRPLSEQIATAASLRGAGYEAVPHMAVRNFASVAAMEDHLKQLVAEAGVTRALVIAGDRPEPEGDLFDALAAIQSGVLQRQGIVEIGVSGYPDGHPRIGDDALAKALTDKLKAAQDAGLRVRIVTQFTMSTDPVVELIKRLRDKGIENPVSIGLAGPTSMTTLLRFARICGVKSSARGLMSNIGLVKNMIGASTADPIVRALTEIEGELGAVNPHFFSFGGLPATTRWVGAVAAGRITLNKEGFEIAR